MNAATAAGVDPDPDELARARELVRGYSALHFAGARREVLTIALREACVERGFASVGALLDHLEASPPALGRFAGALTTKKTQFFRLPDQMRALQNVILPQREADLAEQLGQQLRRGPGSAPQVALRLWSAGCATGEEAWTIAMMLQEGLSFPRAWATEIMATDLSLDALEHASRGVYDESRCALIPAPLRRRYLRPCDVGYRIRALLRRFVSFGLLNLRHLPDQVYEPFRFQPLQGPEREMTLAARFDVIFCRNVLIYFDLPFQQRVVDALSACLRPGGVLFTGDTEILHVYDHRLEARFFGDAIYYQKPRSTRDGVASAWRR